MGSIEPGIITGFISAILIGALIGLEREYEQLTQKVSDFAGIRTFTFIALLGAILGQLSLSLGNSLIIVIGFFSFTLIAISAYIMTSIKQNKVGATTEITSLLAFSLGIMCVTGFAQLAISITVVILMFLAFKKTLTKEIMEIHLEDIYATIEFALVALVVLPFLPNHAYIPSQVPILGDVLNALPLNHAIISQIDIFNPYKIWLMVVLVSGIGYLGYILMKIFGSKRGIGISGMIGGIVSSTAVGIALSKESRRGKSIWDTCAFGVIFSSSTMFIKVIILIAVVNASIFLHIALPMVIMATTGYLAGALVLAKKKKSRSKDLGFKSPFAILPAIKFGLFFALVIFVTKLMLLMLGNSGVYLVSFASGLVGINAITLSIASLASASSITAGTAVNSILVACISNTIFKIWLAWHYGEKGYALKVTKGLGIILAAGLITLAL